MCGAELEKKEGEEGEETILMAEMGAALLEQCDVACFHSRYYCYYAQRSHRGSFFFFSPCLSGFPPADDSNKVKTTFVHVYERRLGLGLHAGEWQCVDFCRGRDRGDQQASKYHLHAKKSLDLLS